MQAEDGLHATETKEKTKRQQNLNLHERRN